MWLSKPLMHLIRQHFQACFICSVSEIIFQILFSLCCWGTIYSARDPTCVDCVQGQPAFCCLLTSSPNFKSTLGPRSFNLLPPLLEYMPTCWEKKDLVCFKGFTKQWLGGSTPETMPEQALFQWRRLKLKTDKMGPYVQKCFVCGCAPAIASDPGSEIGEG